MFKFHHFSLHIQILLCIACSLLPACGIVAILPIEQTQTYPVTEKPTIIPTRTENALWFPATPTARALSTPTTFPTAANRPIPGELIHENIFADQLDWQIFRTDAGNAVVAKGEMTLSSHAGNAGNAGNNVITSYSMLPWQSNLFIQAGITLSLCDSIENSYAFLLRVENSDNYYRWAINCAGETRFERRYRGKNLILSDWVANGQIRPGAPQKYSISINVSGSTFRFYMNDVFLYEITDTAIKDGGLGVSASAKNLSPITVTINSMHLSEVSGANQP